MPGILAASSRPNTIGDLKWLVEEQKISIIITLTEEKLNTFIKNLTKLKDDLQIDIKHIPTIDGTGFFIYQYEKLVKIFLKNVSNKKPILIHCEGGYGRTSTAITAIWMYYYNKSFEDSKKDLIQKNIRPQIMYTSFQLKSLNQWEVELEKKKKKLLK
jgi:protein-tyrosine phosphatase